jgi:hypothetical protein
VTANAIGGELANLTVTAFTVAILPHVEASNGKLVTMDAMGFIGVVMLMSVGFASQRHEVGWIDAGWRLASVVQIVFGLDWAVEEYEQEPMSDEGAKVG